MSIYTMDEAISTKITQLQLGRARVYLDGSDPKTVDDIFKIIFRHYQLVFGVENIDYARATFNLTNKILYCNLFKEIKSPADYNFQEEAFKKGRDWFNCLFHITAFEKEKLSDYRIYSLTIRISDIAKSNWPELMEDIEKKYAWGLLTNDTWLELSAMGDGYIGNIP